MVRFGVSSEKALVALHCQYFEDSMTRAKALCLLLLSCLDELRVTM